MKKSTTYRHLNQFDRDRISALLQAGHLQKDIAGILKVDPGTISREIKNRQRKNGRYEATAAQLKADAARRASKYQGMKVESDPALKKYIITNLKDKRSPDEIAGRMGREKKTFKVSKDAIYHWLYSSWGQRYCPLLCTRRYRIRPRKKPATQRVMIPNRVSIDARPLEAGNKTRYCHFEVDTAVAPRRAKNTEAIALAADMKSKLMLGTKIPSLSPVNMTDALQRFQQQVPMASATTDNGIENKNHEQWGVPTFFADPHSPWQKPLIEQSIGLLRRWFFPKGTDWAIVSEEELQEALKVLNGKYRKSLGYKSALEASKAPRDSLLKEVKRSCA